MWKHGIISTCISTSGFYTAAYAWAYSLSYSDKPAHYRIHSFSTRSQSCITPFGGTSYLPNLLFNHPINALWDLKSGDCTAMEGVWNPWFLNHSWLSCRCVWGHYPAGRWFPCILAIVVRLAIRYHPGLDKKIPSILPSILTANPGPFHIMQPQIIREPPPNFWVLQPAVTEPLSCLFPDPFPPSDPNLLILVSSDHTPSSSLPQSNVDVQLQSLATPSYGT